MIFISNKIIKGLLLISTFLVTVMFLGGDPVSFRGFYYVIWLSFSALLWWHRVWLRERLLRSPFGSGLRFIGLGVCMILVEETIAGTAVNLSMVDNLSQLWPLINQYYANNLLLLPGFIIAWYILLKRYAYTLTEVFVLVGFFGLFAEKIYIHILTIPIIGIPLILPTMFTYMAIIAPSLLSLPKFSTTKIPWVMRYVLGLIFPIIVSIPFLLLHAKLSEIGLIDPAILQR